MNNNLIIFFQSLENDKYPIYPPKTYKNIIRYGYFNTTQSKCDFMNKYINDNFIFKHNSENISLYYQNLDKILAIFFSTEINDIGEYIDMYKLFANLEEEKSISQFIMGLNNKNKTDNNNEINIFNTIVKPSFNIRYRLDKSFLETDYSIYLNKSKENIILSDNNEPTYDIFSYFIILLLNKIIKLYHNNRKIKLILTNEQICNLDLNENRSIKANFFINIFKGYIRYIINNGCVDILSVIFKYVRLFCLNDFYIYQSEYNNQLGFYSKDDTNLPMPEFHIIQIDVINILISLYQNIFIDNHINQLIEGKESNIQFNRNLMEEYEYFVKYLYTYIKTILSKLNKMENYNEVDMLDVGYLLIHFIYPDLSRLNIKNDNIYNNNSLQEKKNINEININNLAMSYIIDNLPFFTELIDLYILNIVNRFRNNQELLIIIQELTQCLCNESHLFFLFKYFMEKELIMFSLKITDFFAGHIYKNKYENKFLAFKRESLYPFCDNKKRLKISNLLKSIHNEDYKSLIKKLYKITQEVKFENNIFSNEKFIHLRKKILITNKTWNYPRSTSESWFLYHFLSKVNFIINKFGRLLEKENIKKNQCLIFINRYINLNKVINSMKNAQIRYMCNYFYICRLIILFILLFLLYKGIALFNSGDFLKFII